MEKIASFLGEYVVEQSDQEPSDEPIDEPVDEPNHRSQVANGVTDVEPVE